MTQININTPDSKIKEQTSQLVIQAISREKRLIQSALEKTLSHLSLMEKKYSLSSEDFYRNYTNGSTDDSDDVVDWAGEYQIYLSLNLQLSQLEDIQVCS